MPKMSLGAPGRVCLNWDERSFRPRLHPPRPTSCVYNNLLPGTSAADVPCDSVHSFPTALRRWRNLAEIDRRAGVGLTRLATGQAKAKNQPRGLLQQRVCRTTDPPKSPHWFHCRLKAKETAPNWGSLYLLFEFLNDNLSVDANRHIADCSSMCDNVIVATDRRQTTALQRAQSHCFSCSDESRQQLSCRR